MTNDDFRQWLDRYGDAWREGEPEAVAQLFCADAAYHETPFDELSESRSVQDFIGAMPADGWRLPTGHDRTAIICASSVLPQPSTGITTG